MDLKSSMEMFYPDHDKYKDDSPFILHWRIGTHGIKNIDNVHPFQVSEREAVVHNGIIKIDIPRGDSRSDTRVFVDEILKRLPEGWQAHAAMRELVRSYIGYSKLAFLDTDRKINIINSSMGTWNDERWFSNDTFVQSRVWGNAAQYAALGYTVTDNRNNNKYVPHSKKNKKNRNNKKDVSDSESYMVVGGVMYKLRAPGVWEPVEEDETAEEELAYQKWLFDNSSYKKEDADRTADEITDAVYAKLREAATCFYCNKSVLGGGEDECIIAAGGWHETTICYSCYMLLEDEAVKEGTNSILVGYQDMVGMIHAGCGSWATEECNGCFERDIPCIHLAYSGDYINDLELELCCHTKFQTGMFDALMSVLYDTLEEDEKQEEKEKVAVNA